MNSAQQTVRAVMGEPTTARDSEVERLLVQYEEDKLTMAAVEKLVERLDRLEAELNRRDRAAG